MSDTPIPPEIQDKLDANPFAFYRYGRYCEAGVVEDRLDKVKTLDAAKLQLVLLLPNLQKTVRKAAAVRLRKLERATKKHKCRCGNSREPWQIACASCWALVPRPLQNKVFRLYKKAEGSPEHIAAVRECLEFICGKSKKSTP